MKVDGQQLAAFAAVIELGSFDAAAERLHVTPSAVSQRIKALEQRVGQVLVVREKPCTATAAGVPLLRLAAQTALLEAEALAEMGGGRWCSAANCVGGQRRFDGDVVHRGVRRAGRRAVRRPDRGPGSLGAVAARGRGDGGGDHRAHARAGLPGAAIGSDALHPGGKPYLREAVSAGWLHCARRR